jgi:hypothetical protein
MIGQIGCRGRKPTLHPRCIRITAEAARPGDRPGLIVVTRVSRPDEA